MKIYVRISIHLEKETKEGRKIYDEFRTKMKKYNLEGMPSYRIALDDEIYDYAQSVVEYCQNHDVGIEISDEGPNEFVYNKKDYESAAAYRVWFLQSSYTYDEIEDVEECCCVENERRGLYNTIQVKPYYLPKNEFGKKNCTQLDNGGYAVSKAVRDDLIQLGATEEDFWPVYTKKREIVCYQLMPKYKVSLGEVNGWKKNCMSVLWICTLL